MIKLLHRGFIILYAVQLEPVESLAPFRTRYTRVQPPSRQFSYGRDIFITKKVISTLNVKKCGPNAKLTVRNTGCGQEMAVIVVG